MGLYVLQNEPMNWAGFLHTDTNLGKHKITLVITGWAWPKKGHGLLGHVTGIVWCMHDFLHADSDAIIFGKTHCISLFGKILYLSVFSPNVGKYGPEKTPYLDIFHAVTANLTPSLWLLNARGTTAVVLVVIGWQNALPLFGTNHSSLLVFIRQKLNFFVRIFQRQTGPGNVF